MSKTAIGVVAIAAMFGTPILAAEMPLKAPPPPAVFSWTGFYVGANAGYSWGDSSDSWNILAANFAAGPTCPPAGVALCISGAASNRLNGVLGGLQAGYNWQTANYLFGLEADIDATGQRGSQIFNGVNAAPSSLPIHAAPMSASYTEQLRWLGTFRGRIGLVSDHSLFYVTGGLAFGEISNAGSAIISGASVGTPPGAPACSGGAPVAAGSTCPLSNWSNTSAGVGWTLGIGAEQAFAGNWSVKVEYLHVDLGRINTTFATFPGCFGGPGSGCLFIGSGTATISSRITDDLVRVGLNYRFHHL